MGWSSKSQERGKSGIAAIGTRSRSQPEEKGSKGRVQSQAVAGACKFVKESVSILLCSRTR